MLINTSCAPVTSIASLLSSIGAINWGLIGIFDFNLVTYLLGSMTGVTKILYILIGLSGLYSFLCLGRFLCKPTAQEVK
ncbi:MULTISPECIES: DUF378 domain-containing protein [unclassified Rickettsia]|uniref:DUF378 domain-containing protein n=1 Tax=unclassified Rickettsia TaxID=114295 RepID=UPI0020A1C421|nr:DUF378 domain-containing protein [Rickettsia endosymbiont of Ceutorhynchus assimilis]